MVHKARTLCDKENLHDMLEFLKTTLKENSYSLKQIWCALYPMLVNSKYKGEASVNCSPATCPGNIWPPQQNVG